MYLHSFMFSIVSIISTRLSIYFRIAMSKHTGYILLHTDKVLWNMTSARGLCKGKLWSMKLEQTRPGGCLECERYCRQTQRGLYHYITPGLGGMKSRRTRSSAYRKLQTSLYLRYLFHVTINVFCDCQNLHILKLLVLLTAIGSILHNVRIV